MAKNIVFVVVDSVFRGRLMEQRHRHSPTPFLNSLERQSIVLEQLYSQAPFTEAALSSLLCGCDLLDGGGYIQRLKYKHTVMEQFQKNGYEVFGNHLAPQSYPSAMFPGMDVMYHQSYYVFREFWDYRMYYYVQPYQEGTLTEEEWSRLKDMMAENLEAWIQQLTLLAKRDPQVEILSRSSDLAFVEKDLAFVTEQYRQFLERPKQYIGKLLRQQTQHVLFSIPKRTCDRRVPPDVQDQVRRRYRAVFDRIYRLNRDRNLRNLPFPAQRTARCLAKRDKAGAKAYLQMYRDAVWDSDLYERIGPNYTTFRASVPMRTYIDHFFGWYDQRPNGEQPLFTYLHVDDAHTPETFFTWDSSDLSLLDREFQDIQRFLSALPDNYYGSLTSDLSLRYVDRCIQYLFEEMECRGMLDDTAVVITADHGFCFSYDPIRQEYWNDFHRENYNTPFILYERGRAPARKQGLYMAKDVAPTLLDVCGLAVPKQMTGRSVLQFAGRDYVRHEYMGLGCPDMLRRPMRIAVRTERYLVSIQIPIKEPFERHELTEIYDLKRDPMEFDNLVGKCSPRRIYRELAILARRFAALQHNFAAVPNAFNTAGVYEARRAGLCLSEPPAEP